MMPKEGEKGPALAFRIRLNEENAGEELDRLIAGIIEKKVPQNWVITPSDMPSHLVEIMEQKGFQNLSAGATPEPGMLLRKEEFVPYQLSSAGIICRKVQTKQDFQLWIHIVNTALHGWDMIDAEHYAPWIENEWIDVYVGEIDGTPVATAATFRSGESASLEFVSTLEEARRRGVASVVCSKALADLFARGVEEVTLSACGESVKFYEKLGFQSYFHHMIMRYEI